MRSKLRLLVFMGLLAQGLTAWANPRFVTGTTYAQAGVPMAWGVSSLTYYTDPANLNQLVSHAQADSIVAAAAAVWNVPTANLTLSQGGVLSEHVSSGNTYFDGTNVVFPADVEASNYAAKPIAVIYDSDGSITDLLLGQGASDPSGCRQSEVTESVDGFELSGTIQHALLVINGRCVGSSNDELMQMKYDVMRAFGRILGLGWSQTNDNVFTASPVPTAAQMSYWPVMHPIDVLCGPYTYLCMQNPFALRQDDLSSLAQLYPVTAVNQQPGKTVSMNGMLQISANISFPTGTGMDSINMTMSRVFIGNPTQPWQFVSGITGYPFQINGGNPVTGAADPAENEGMSWTGAEGQFNLLVPYDSRYLILVEMEPINPLYTGMYALGPTVRPPVSMSGTAFISQIWASGVTSDTFSFATHVQDAASVCFTNTNGWEGGPQPVNSTGWWSDVLCGPTRPAWGSVKVRAGRTWTIETTALDETGGATVSKAQPVIGVWNAGDPTGTLPTVASAPVPMNALVPGMTQLTLPAATTDGSYRITIADAYGGGRPDFAYKARVLYADSITPATVATSGGQFTINGEGFANGNRVTVNGVTAQVLSWSPNQIVAVAPSMTIAKAQPGVPVDVSVVDLTTNGSTTITGALTYPGGGAEMLTKVSAPTVLETGVTAGIPFAVKVLASDGVTPIAGASVTFAVTSGSAGLASCGVAVSCTLVTNSVGIAQTSVTGSAAGTAVLTATAVSGGATVQVSMVDADPVRSLVLQTPTKYVAAGATVSLPVNLMVVQDGLAASGVPVSWAFAQGLSASVASSVSGSGGAVAATITASGLPEGTWTAQACAWAAMCTNWNVVSVGPEQWMPQVASGAGQSVSASSSLAPVSLRITDALGHALAGATVTVQQTVTAWEGTCAASGRCAAAPVLAANQTTAVADANGMVSVTPLQVSGVPQVVNIAASSGSQGFVSLSLVKTP